MLKARLTLVAVALLATACASAPAPQPVAAASRRSPVTDDLEAAHKLIEAREQKPVDARVDIESAASIPIPSHPSIGRAIALFTNDLKASVQESFLRSAQYKPLIDRVLAEYNLPKALAYLPVIESAYMPTLTSRAGARGIWQFMAPTAREYGLRVDWWVDERADPERSTRAAAAYLKDLYRQFNDWPLALAAYNAGAGRVHRALTSSGSATFWDLLERTAVPAETRGYVPTFFATITIASDPAAYGFRLGDPVSRDVRKVEVEGPVSLRYIAQVANIDESMLTALNPALRRGIVPPGRVFITVPSQAASEVASRATMMKSEDATIALCSFTLRDGDSLRRIATAIGSDVDTLVAMNDGRSAGAGDTIYLPVRGRELANLLAGEKYYSVRKGDTIYSIARRFDLSVDELRDLNQISRHHKLHPGDKLRVSTSRALTAGM